MSTNEHSDALPLGYCLACSRVRWIEKVAYWVHAPRADGQMDDPMPHGTCTQCVREGRGSGSELLGPEPSENFSAAECEHGYDKDCPDCDVPAHQPTVMQNVPAIKVIQKLERKR